MVQRVNFTVERVANFQCVPNKTQSFLRDARTPGLGLRVTLGGSRTYIFEARAGNKVLRRKIGDARTMLLKDAQAAATDLKRLTDAKKDPRELDRQHQSELEAEEQKRQVENSPALLAWNIYIESNDRDWSERYKLDHAVMSRPAGGTITRGKRPGMPDTKESGILRPILELPLAAITRTRIEAWVDGERSRRPTRTRLALSMLTAFLNWCRDHNQEVIDFSGTRTEVYPYRDQVNENVCKRIKKRLGTPEPKKDVLQVEQLPLWFDAAGHIPNRIQSAYLQCLLLTGARRNEVASLRWEDVDLEWKTLNIRDKVEGNRTIPLTPYVETLLLELRKLNRQPQRIHNILRAKSTAIGDTWKPSPWVFRSATSASGRIQEPRIAHNKALASVGLPALSIHGLRRSFGTLAEWVECPAGISAQIMGHKPSAIAEKHYRQRPIGLLRVWHTRIETWILEHAQIELPRNNPDQLAYQRQA
jgi:integrase